MSRLLPASLVALLAFALPAAAQAYTQTMTATTTVNGQNHIFTFGSLPSGSGLVTLTVGLQGDFSYGNLNDPEGSENYADGNFLGSFIPANVGPAADCDGTVYTTTYTFPVSYINDNNEVIIRIDLYPQVNAFCTGQQDISATITYVSNVAPSAAAASVGPVNEGAALTMVDSGSSDSDGTITLYEWDCESDGTYEHSAATPNSSACTWDDDGSYNATLRVTDDDGAVDTDTVSVTVNNVAPTITTLTAPASGNEGSVFSFTGAATDPSSVDAAALTYSWSWGDGTANGSGTTPSHVYVDDGTFTVGLTVSDPDGGFTTSTASVVVNNVAPTILSTGPTVALEGSLYSYSPTTTDPGANDTMSFALISGPAGVSVTSGPGLVSWTPVYADVGVQTIVYEVSDGDGGTDSETITVAVAFIDSEPDGMADTWESDNGLDPTLDDSGGDPDGDGLTNLEEFGLGQDPQSFDGPGAPELTSPKDGDETSATPTLTWSNAVDPQNDTLLYDVEVYSDALLGTLVTSATDLPGTVSGSNAWTVDVTLVENTEYYWRARASDPWADGPWAVAEAFFVNEVNELPTVPTPFWPVDGEVVSSLTPSPQWVEASDPDRDLLTYVVRIWDEAMESVLTTGTVLPLTRDISWPIDITLDEDGRYHWDVRAIDEHGLEGDWSEAEPFIASSSNDAPAGPVFVRPEDNDAVDGLSPELAATEVLDPEGGAVSYRMELDTAASFAGDDFMGFDLAATGTGEVTLDLASEGVELTEHTTWYARVQASDAEGTASDWDLIRFFVRGENDPPEGSPILISPEDGTSTLDTALTFVWGHLLDPEEDEVVYELGVFRDAELTDLVQSLPDLEQGSGEQGSEDQTSAGLELSAGTYSWSVRGVDERGAEGAWADPFTLVIEAPAGDDDDDTLTGGCDCGASLASSGAGPGAWALALLLIPAIRRRR